MQEEGMTIDIAILLASIAVVESNSDDAAIGKAGERGRYQLTKAVWEQVLPPSRFHESDEEFEFGAHSLALSRYVAAKHIELTIIPALEKAGREVTVFAIASCWNAGVTGYIKHGRGSGYARKVVEEYAKREKGKD
jgi:hypothetical protein